MRINFGKLSDREIEDLIREAWPFLTEERQYALLEELLVKEQKEELALSWGPAE